jgi:DNA end-binding protein Ku
MPSAVWSGHLHFGLVVMPVRLLVAARPKTTRFRRLYRRPSNHVMPPMQLPWSKQTLVDEDSYSDGAGESGVDTHNRESSVRGTQYDYAPVRQVLQSEVTGEVIRRGELVKGYEFARNEFAAINPQEIKAAEVETSDTIDLFHFVNGADVDPIYFERSYYVAPDSGAEKVYALLLEAMRREKCFGIARIGMHRREHMLILRPTEDCLVAHTMFHANEVRPAPDLELAPEFTDKEISMATALMKGYAGEFDPTQFKDIYQERIRKIIDAEVSNRIDMSPTPARKIAGAPDLMEQIRLSLAQIESERSDAKSSKKPVRKTVAVAKKKPQRVRA